MDPELERVIGRLEARFDAALAREDEVAARDLQVSLRHGQALADLLRSGTALRLLEADGATSEVTAIGSDYCGIGVPLSCIRRLGRTAFLVTADGAPPEVRRDSLHEVADRWARAGRRVELTLETDRLYAGRLGQVGPDNMVLEGSPGRVIVSLELVRSIRLAHEG